MQCVILSGVPGCGKSTYIENNFKHLDAKICSADDWFMIGGEYKFDFRQLSNAHGACLKKFIDQIISDKNVIVDNTNTTIDEIVPYYAIAAAYGYDIKLITIFLEPELCAKRNVHGVPYDSIVKMDGRLRARKLPEYWKFNSKFLKEDISLL